jgi:hypothetical protein
VAAIAMEIFDLKHKAAAGHGVNLFVSLIGHLGKPVATGPNSIARSHTKQPLNG